MDKVSTLTYHHANSPKNNSKFNRSRYCSNNLKTSNVSILLPNSLFYHLLTQSLVSFSNNSSKITINIKFHTHYMPISTMGWCNKALVIPDDKDDFSLSLVQTFNWPVEIHLMIHHKSTKPLTMLLNFEIYNNK